MKLGIEKKEERWKVYVLGALALVGGWVVYSNLTPDAGTPSTTPVAQKPLAEAPPPAPSPVPRRRNGRVAGDFRPKLRSERVEDRPDTSKIDPTIKMGLLARVQNSAMEGGSRNIFQFGAAAPAMPTTPVPKVNPIIPAKPATLVQQQPPPMGPGRPGAPPPPPAPPIPLKYYGYSSVKGEPRKRAFFLDGDDVIVAWEGDLIKNRYKVIHVGLRAVDMEDTQFKNGKQTLNLAEDVSG